MKKILTVGLLVASLSITANATVTAVGNVTKVMTYPGVAIIKMNKPTSGCTFPNNSYLILDTTTTNGRSVYSAALTGFTTGAKVQIAYSGCRAFWGKTLPKMYRLDMIK